MSEFNIKLRNESKKVDLKSFNSNFIKIKAKLKGKYKDIKFKAEIILKIRYKNNSLEIIENSISNLELNKNNSYSGFIYDNIYTLNSFSSSDLYSDDKITKKIYTQLKLFLNKVKISHNDLILTSIIFDNENLKISKINMKGNIKKQN